MGSLFTGRPAGRPVACWSAAIEPRRDAPAADRHPRERGRHALRLPRRDLHEGEGLPDVNLAEGALLESDLADQRAHEILRAGAILPPDVHEDLDPAGGRR